MIVKKKQTLEGLAIIVTDKRGLLQGVPDRILKFFSLFHCSSHDAHYVTTFDARASSLALKCFYRHVLSRMNHYEYATVSILLAFRDYRRARVMHMREAAHLYPNFSSKSFEVEAFLYLLFRSPSPKSEYRFTRIVHKRIFICTFFPFENRLF